MRATTHTEVYRRFEGELRSHPLRFWPLFASGVRVSVRKKLPLLLLYAVPTIATVIFCFLVYAKFAAEAGIDAIGGLEGGMAKMAANRAMQQLEVERQIVGFHQAMTWFSLLATAWFGAGLLAEDRRVGAHQLYFSRPMTKVDYFLGKLAVACFFSACALLVPGLVICLVASFSSPEWSFLKDRWDVILKTLAYSSIWVLVSSSAALCASSIAPRRVFALVGLFAFFVLSFGAAGILGEEVSASFFVLSPILDMWVVGAKIFDVEPVFPDVPVGRAAWSLAAVLTLSLGIVALRLRKLEVVA